MSERGPPNVKPGVVGLHCFGGDPPKRLRLLPCKFVVLGGVKRTGKLIEMIKGIDPAFAPDCTYGTVDYLPPPKRHNEPRK